MIRQKSWLPGSGAYFPLYKENFLKSFSETTGVISILGRNVPWVTLYQDCMVIGQKTWPPGSGAYFPSVICFHVILGLPDPSFSLTCISPYMP